LPRPRASNVFDRRSVRMIAASATTMPFNAAH
jgi:hypothetical protein